MEDPKSDVSKAQVINAWQVLIEALLAAIMGLAGRAL